MLSTLAGLPRERAVPAPILESALKELFAQFSPHCQVAVAAHFRSLHDREPRALAALFVSSRFCAWRFRCRLTSAAYIFVPLLSRNPRAIVHNTQGKTRQPGLPMLSVDDYEAEFYLSPKAEDV